MLPSQINILIAMVCYMAIVICIGLFFAKRANSSSSNSAVASSNDNNSNSNAKHPRGART